VQIERERFAGTQAQATALLGMIGLVASIGGGFATAFMSRNYKWPIHTFGQEISLALILAASFGLVALLLLYEAGLAAIGILRQKADPEDRELVPIVAEEFPKMIEDEEGKSARVLLALLADQLRRTQEVNSRVGRNLKRVAQGLGAGVIVGIIVVVILLVGSAADHHRFFQVKEVKKSTLILESSG
jgi:hypothetical protein